MHSLLCLDEVRRWRGDASLGPADPPGGGPNPPPGACPHRLATGQDGGDPDHRRHPVTTTSPTPGTTAPPVPFDPELAAALSVFAEFLPPAFTPEMIPLLRQPNPAMPAPTDEDLARGGVFTVEERAVPGPEGAPDVSLLVCRPAAATAPTAAIYHIHGGGMIIGDNRSGMLEMLDYAEEFGLAVVSVEYRLAPETRTPARWRTATRASCGPPSTPPSCASTRRGSWWAGPAPGVACRLRWR